MEIHITRLSMLWRCGEQFRRRYIKNEIIPPSIALITGSAVHKTIDKNLSNKIDNKILLPLDIIEDMARDEISSSFNSGIKLQEDEINIGLKNLKGQTIDTAVGLSKLHYTDLAPKINPIAIEKKFTLNIDNNDKYNVVGTIDIEENDTVRDTKTAGRVDKNSANTSNQLTMYALARKIQGKAIKEVILDVLVKNKTPRVETLVSTRNQSHFDAILRRVKNAIDQIDSGIFPPCNPDNWWCSERFCGYYDSCPYIGR